VIPLSAEEAGRALGLDRLAAPVGAVCTDSRRVRPGDLFVALRGERFDGHDFVAEVLAAGASGAVVEKCWWMEGGERSVSAALAGQERSAGPPAAWRQVVYPVDDTLSALGALARQVRRKSAAKVVAVTGSVGKTSTKDLIGAMARRVCRVVETPANQNNEVGVPLTLLAIELDTELVVVEMGMRGPGQIDSLARVAEPDVGLVTNIHPVHLELLGTLDNIAQAKAELFACLGSAGIAVIPADCGLLGPYAGAAACRVIRFGFGACSCTAETGVWDATGVCAEADVPGGAPPANSAQAAEIYGWLGLSGPKETAVLHVRWPEGEVELEAPFVSRHRLVNAAAAAAACYAAGLPVERCVAGLEDARFSGSRGDIVRLAGLVVIDDTYNASPAAVRAALDDLIELAAESGGRPVAVLGDMLELGPEAEDYHEAAGAYGAAAGVRALWGVGPLSESTVRGFRRAWAAGGAGATPRTVADVEAGNVRSADEASLVLAGLRRGDVVLLKASRSMGLEVLVRRIIEAAAAGTWAGEPDADKGGATEGSQA
jgi:UDP-N-acetylmuramoyl-tripeptide--D-alanyl-D-alanine ligase